MHSALADAPPESLAGLVRALLTELTRLAPPPTAGLDPEEAAAYLGFLGRSTLDSYAAAGLVPAPHKVGGKVVYCRAELDAWLAHGCPPRADWSRQWAALRSAKK